MTYQVLSLDGGGAWALLEVRALIEMYGPNAKGRSILSKFDMVAGNSGGALVVGALLEDLPLSTILQYFVDPTKRAMMFSPTSSWGDRILEDLVHLGPKYSTDAKLHGILQLLPASGSQPLAHLAQGLMGRSGKPLRILITTFDYDRQKGVIFRSVSSTAQGWGVGDTSQVTLGEAIHASSTAPVNYFDQPAVLPSYTAVPTKRYWDGGVSGLNNPVLAAVTEAIQIGIQPQDVRALSVGTATVALPLGNGTNPDPKFLSPTSQSLVADIGKLAGSILDDPPDTATFIAHAITGGPNGLPISQQSRIVRLNALISPVITGGAWAYPNPYNSVSFQYLSNVGMDAPNPMDVPAIQTLGDGWIAGTVRNQPIRMDGDTLKREVGYDSFGEAIASWNNIT